MRKNFDENQAKRLEVYRDDCKMCQKKVFTVDLDGGVYICDNCGQVYKIDIWRYITDV